MQISWAAEGREQAEQLDTLVTDQRDKLGQCGEYECEMLYRHIENRKAQLTL